MTSTYKKFELIINLISRSFSPAELPPKPPTRRFQSWFARLEYRLLFFLAHPHVGLFDLKPGERLGLATRRLVDILCH